MADASTAVGIVGGGLPSPRHSIAEDNPGMPTPLQQDVFLSATEGSTSQNLMKMLEEQDATDDPDVIIEGSEAERHFVAREHASRIKVDTMAHLLLDTGDKNCPSCIKPAYLARNKSKRTKNLHRSLLRKLSMWALACTLGGAVLAAGAVMQIVTYFDDDGANGTDSSAVVPLDVTWRAMYVIGSLPFVYLACWWAVELVLIFTKAAETDVMNFNKIVRRDGALFLCLLVEVLWVYLVFNVLLCDTHSIINSELIDRFQQTCQVESFQKAASSFQRLFMCLLVFAVANLITSVFARLSSLFFVHMKHFDKLQDVLEEDHFLKMLSTPRPEAGDNGSEGMRQPFSRAFSSSLIGSRYHVELSAQGLGLELARNDRNLQRPLDALLSSIMKKDFEHADRSELTSTNSFLIEKLAHRLYHASHFHAFTDAQKDELQDRVTLFAHLMYRNIAHDSKMEDGVKPHITIQDIRPFFTPDRKGDKLAHRAHDCLDSNRDDKILLDEFVASIQKIFGKREALAQALEISRNMVLTIMYGISACIHSVFVALYVKIWGLDSAGSLTFVIALLALLGTGVLSVVRELFSSVLFVVVVHPYDIGDTVILYDHFGTVRSVSLAVTELTKSSGEVLFVPNSNLREENIINLSRGSYDFNAVRIEVDVGVSKEVRQELQASMLQFMAEHPDDFVQKATRVHLTGIGRDNLKIEMGIDFMYAFPPDCWSRKKPARDAIFSIISDVLRKYKQNGGIKATCEEVVETRAESGDHDKLE